MAEKNKEEKKTKEVKKSLSAFSEKAGKNFDQPFGKRLRQVAKTEEEKKIEEAKEGTEKKEKSNEERKEGMKKEKKKTEIVKEEKEKSRLEEEIQKESVEKVAKEEKKVKKKPFPWILALLAVILIVVAGFAIQKVLENQEVKKGEWDTEITKTPVEIKSFYSSECSFCEKENSIIANFKSEERNIPVKVESIDLAKEENKHYINEFGLKSVPTALVNAKDLANYPLVENLIKESFEEKNGYFVVPETYLDGGKHNIMLLDALECDSGEGKIFVEQFCDYQTPGCALIFEPTKKARERFAGEIVFEYKNYLLHGEKSETTAIVAECAKEQGRFFGFNKYLYEKQFPQAFGIDREPVDNSSSNVINAGTFVTQMPDLNAFNKCIEEKEPMQKIKDDNSFVLAYGVYFTPSLVFDCRYIVQGHENASKIEEIICVLHPELEGCKEK